MNHTQFVEGVQRRAALGSSEEADRIIQAALEALAEHLSKDAAEDLATQLPQEIGQYLRHRRVGESGEALALDEYVDHVGERVDARDPEQAASYTRAVLRTVEEASEAGSGHSSLPQELDPLLERGPGESGLPGSGG